MICNNSYYPPLRPENRLNVENTMSNTKKKKEDFDCRLKKRTRLLSQARWVDLRAFRLLTTNLRATLFRGHIEEDHVLRFLSLDEKSALSTRKARERLLLNENYNTTTYYNNDGERRSRKTGRAHDDDEEEEKKRRRRRRKKEESYHVDDDSFYVCGLVVHATERTLRLGENFPRRDVLGPGGAWRRGRRPSLLFSPRNDDDDDDDDDDATLAVSRRGYRNAQKGKTEVGSGLTQA